MEVREEACLGVLKNNCIACEKKKKRMGIKKSGAWAYWEFH